MDNINELILKYEGPAAPGELENALLQDRYILCDGGGRQITRPSLQEINDVLASQQVSDMEIKARQEMQSFSLKGRAAMLDGGRYCIVYYSVTNHVTLDEVHWP